MNQRRRHEHDTTSSDLNSSDSITMPMERAVLDCHSLVAAIEARLSDPACSPAFLLLVVLEDATGAPVTDAELSADVGCHLGAMIRSTDLIASLDAGELAMVVFDLPPIQRMAFADGISMAINGVLDAVSPDAGLRAFVGTSAMRSDAPITDAFRLADRMLKTSENAADQLAVSTPVIVG